METGHHKGTKDTKCSDLSSDANSFMVNLLANSLVNSLVNLLANSFVAWTPVHAIVPWSNLRVMGVAVALSLRDHEVLEAVNAVSGVGFARGGSCGNGHVGAAEPDAP